MIKMTKNDVLLVFIVFHGNTFKFSKFIEFNWGIVNAERRVD